MTVRIVLASTVLALALSACASGPRPSSNYGTELEQLSTDCAERGGILTPLGGGTTGRPQTDYACRISGGASRIQ